MTGAFFSTGLALVAACTLVVGSAIPVWRFDFFQKKLGLLIGFSAGLMLATALHKLIPEALEADARHAMTGAAFGFLTLYAAERLTHFHACRHRRCEIDPDELDLEELKRVAALEPQLEPAGHHSHPHSHAQHDGSQT